jgi:hypothetical protein
LVRTVEFFGIVVFNDRGGACPAAELLNERGGERYVSRIPVAEKTRNEEKKKHSSPRIGLAVCIVNLVASPSNHGTWVVGNRSSVALKTWEFDQ